MQILEVGTNNLLADLSEKAKMVEPDFVDAGAGRYRRGDTRLVSDDSPDTKGEFRVEFERLSESELGSLRTVYRDHAVFIMVPDRESEPLKAYLCRWASGLDFTDTAASNWSVGKSVRAVFREI